MWGCPLSLTGLVLGLSKETMAEKSVDVSTSSEQNAGAASRQQRLRDALEQRFPDRLFRLPDHAWKELGLTYGVRREHSAEVFRSLRDEEPFSFNMLIDVTCVDWLDHREPRFDVVY